jgi:hypothetical protein
MKDLPAGGSRGQQAAWRLRAEIDQGTQDDEKDLLRRRDVTHYQI